MHEIGKAKVGKNSGGSGLEVRSGMDRNGPVFSQPTTAIRENGNQESTALTATAEINRRNSCQENFASTKAANRAGD